MTKLTRKQLLFCKEYIVDLNGTQAAIRAGYSKKTANEQAARLLANVSIKEAVQEQVDARTERTLITADFVLTSLKEVALRCMQKELVKAGVWRFDSTGANRALELLGKHLNLFKEGLLDDLPPGAYVQIYRPEKYTHEELEAASRPTNRSI